MKRAREEDDDEPTKRARNDDKGHASPFCDLVIADVCTLMAAEWLTVTDRVHLNRTCTLFRTLFPVSANVVPAPWLEFFKTLDIDSPVTHTWLSTLDRDRWNRMPRHILELADFSKSSWRGEFTIMWPRVTCRADKGYKTTSRGFTINGPERPPAYLVPDQRGYWTRTDHATLWDYLVAQFARWRGPVKKTF